MSDIEPTQALPMSDYDNETDDEQGDSERKPVSLIIIKITDIRQGITLPRVRIEGSEQRVMVRAHLH